MTRVNANHLGASKQENHHPLLDRQILFILCTSGADGPLVFAEARSRSRDLHSIDLCLNGSSTANASSRTGPRNTSTN